MNIASKKLPKSEVELTIELSVEEMKPFMEKAAVRLSTEKPIEGFRPGKASLDVVVKKFGEAPVLEAAAEEAVRGTYPQAVIKEKIAPIGSPAVDVKKMAPGNPFIYTATVALIPEITLCDLGSVSVSKKEAKVPEEDVARAIKDLRFMRAKEVVAARPATNKDKVVIDMDMKMNGVAIEGGQAKGHQVYMDEPHYIPGFAEQLVGLKKDDAKNFTLTFPKDHFQKTVAGKPVEFTVKVNDVFERTLPEIDDEFAKGFGQKSAVDLEKLIRENLLAEADTKENQRVEIAALEGIIKSSKFGDIPDLLVNEEVFRMVEELKRGIAERGMDWKEYLEKAGKTENQLKLDFAPQAVDRIKAALVVRAVAEQNNIEATDAEVAAEVEKEITTHSDDAKLQEEIRSEEYQDRVRIMLKNRKAVQFIKDKVIR